MAKTKRVVDAMMSGVKTPAQMKAEMAMDRARTVLPQAEREANKAKFLEESAVKDRLYHGTTSDVNEFDPSKARSKTGNINAVLGTFMSDNPAEASRYASEWGTTGGNVMPVYASLKNPYNASYKEMDDLAMGVYRRMMQDPSYDQNRVVRGLDKEGHQRTFKMIEKHEPGALQDAIDFKNKLIEAGHDGIIWNLNGNKEVIAFEPTQIKSAIGNQGTYNPADPDITKAHGGAVHMAGGGAGRKLANKLLPKVEAPSIMTRSDISELAEYIKNREGGYGLRRVERAADEIPRLGELYSQDALREAFSGDNARALMTLKPSEFEKYAIPLEDNLRDESVKNIANLIGIRHKGGFDSVPYFEVNKEEQGLPLLPFISGHEGRHRNRALSAAGEEAGLVQFLPRAELREPFPRRSQEDYIEALKREMSITGNKVLPQVWRESSKNSLEDITIRRPAIDLPDLYAEGGAVKPPAIFEEAQVPFEEIRRQLGMKSGGAVHMQDGGDPQAEIDRMRLELSNSPVIQATPQTPIQRAIGTLGGYMDRAGQFVSESIEPLAEKHPIKHFLGELLLADSLKSAGTAMQDYTKTSRDITEDQPYVRAPLTGSGQTLKLDPRMLDVAGFAQPVASATTRLVGAGAKKAAPFAKDVAEMASELYAAGKVPGMPSPNAYVVKPKGGNWLSGSIEKDIINPLRESEWINGEIINEVAGENLWAKMIEEGGQTNPHGWLRANRPEILKKIDPVNFSIDNWLNTKLRKYVQNEMGTTEDPLREMSRRGVSHIPEEDLLNAERWVPEEIYAKRAKAGFPREGLASKDVGSPADVENAAQLGSGWENIADMVIGVDTASKKLKDPRYVPDNASVVEENPWLTKVPPETRVYSLSGDYIDSGFNHLLDEMRNAMRADSDLPERFRIDPAKLEKMTVPQVVERVSQINAWRAEQIGKANAEKANNAATQVVKDYPEQGYKWVELRQSPPPEVIPEGWKMIEEKGGVLRAVSPDGDRVLGENLPDLVANIYKRHPDAPGNPKKALADALKYEGDTMGHCVGGYCPDVIEGKSRIYSLRDAKGEPHVTIEVEPPMFNRASRWGDLSQEEKTGMLWNLGSPGDKALLEKYGDDMQIYFRPDGSVRLMPPKELLDAETIAKSTQPTIKQIKGKGNAKPKDSYLPFVQDFVKGGEWSEVRDFKNTGLIKEGGQMMTPAEHADWLAKQLEVPPQNMKRGGKVSFANDIDAMRLALSKG